MNFSAIESILQGASFIYLEQADSTNNIARQYAKDGAKEYTCVAARSQTGGRGRVGRQFFSYNGGVYLSVILRPRINAKDSLLITVAAAVAAAEAINEFSGKVAQIKWVNDIYVDGKKVCGILTEGSIAGDGLDFAVLGIGVNLFAPVQSFPDEISNIAGHIVDAAAEDKEKHRFIALFLERFDQYYKKIEAKEYLAAYREKSLLTGQEISFERNGAVLCGRVIGIDDNAALIVECGGEKLALSHGEVQIKRFKRKK